MNTVFADTYYFIALLNPKDSAHTRASDFSRTSRAHVVSSICVFTSFVIMQEHGLTEALTGDHHFEQAGFRALLKE